MSEHLLQDGIMVDAWTYNNDNPPKKVFPYLVKKKSALQRTFDVFLTGRSDECTPMSLDELLDLLSNQRYSDGARIRVKSLNSPGSQGNGYPIRKLKFSERLKEELTKRRAARSTLKDEFSETVDEFERQIDVASALSDQELTDALINSREGKPNKKKVEVTVFERNPFVVVATLRRAKGVCEECLKPAPFIRTRDNSPYLEVHHKIMLSEGGEDTVDNAIALCPNCHRKMHYGDKT